MIFYALTSAGPQGWCRDPNLKIEGFNNPEGYTADVSVSENHVSSLLQNLSHFDALKPWKKCFEKLNFCITYNGTQKHERFVIPTIRSDFKNELA